MKEKWEKPFQITFVTPTSVASVYEPSSHDYSQM